MRRLQQQGRCLEHTSRSESHEKPDQLTCTASSGIGSWMPFSTSFINGAPLLLPSPRRYRFRCPQASFRGRRCFGLRCREISDGSDHLPECTLHIHRDRRRSLWTPFRPCSAPSVPILGLATAVRGGHLQLDHGWNSAQSKTYGCNHCVKLAAVRSSPQVQILQILPGAGS